MDNTFKYIGAGIGGAIVSILALRLVTSPATQHMALLFIITLLAATLAMLIVNIYLFSRQLAANDSITIVHHENNRK